MIKIAGIVYIPGFDKRVGGRSHLYRGTYEHPGHPMCPAGWNRGTDYSIIRGDSRNGVCGECWQNAKERKPTAQPRKP